MSWIPPMIIDFHSHCGDEATRKWGDMIGADRTVIFSGPGGEDYTLSVAKESDGKYIPFAWFDAKSLIENPSQVSTWRERGFKGVKIQPMTQQIAPDDERLIPVWAELEKEKLPIVTHIGAVGMVNHEQRYCRPDGWDRIAHKHPELPIIFAHLGANYGIEAIAIAETYDNVYLDTANLAEFAERMLPEVTPMDLLTRAVRILGYKKIMFASEGTTPDLVYNCLAVNREGRKHIMWKNALKVMGEPMV